MGNLTLNGATSGQITLAPTAVAGTNTLTLPAATGTVLTTAGGQTVSGNTTVSGTVVMGSPFTMRNKIINGAMVIDQRNAGASVTPANGAYTLDRWQNYVSQSSKFSVQQVSDGPSGFQKSLKVTSLSAYTVLSSDFFTVEQVIEGFNTADLAYGSSSAVTTTLSFWVKSSLTGTFGGALYNNGLSTYANTFSYTINSANTWEQKTVTITGATGSTWNTTNGASISVSFSVGMGSTYQTAAGSWGSTTGRSVSGAVNVVSTNAATWQVTGVQLEIGTAATPFEYRNYQQELAMCQRYCTVITRTDTTNNTGNNFYFGGGNVYTSQGAFFIPLEVRMRSAPTASFSAASTFYSHLPGQATIAVSAVTLYAASVDHLAIGVTNSSSPGGNFPGFLVPNANQTATITASAEL